MKIEGAFNCVKLLTIEPEASLFELSLAREPRGAEKHDLIQ